MALGAFAHIGTTGGLQQSIHLYRDGSKVPSPWQVSNLVPMVVFPKMHQTFGRAVSPAVAEALNYNGIYPGYYVQRS